MNMNRVNGSPHKKPLVTITPYNEQDKRGINGSTGVDGPPPPPLPAPSPAKTNEDAVEMQSIESFKLKDCPSPVIPKPPPTYFTSSTTSPSSTPSNGSPRHSVSLTKMQVNGNPKESQTSVSQLAMEKKSVSKVYNGSVTTTAGGKVAVKIGSYEGDVKPPSRLEFLPVQPRTVVDSGSPINEEISTGPVVSRLQNELVATLQRSNLKKKTDEEIVVAPQSPAKISSSPDNPRPVSLLQSNVEKLAAALSNRVTIKVNPENGSR